MTDHSRARSLEAQLKALPATESSRVCLIAAVAPHMSDAQLAAALPGLRPGTLRLLALHAIELRCFNAAGQYIDALAALAERNVNETEKKENR